MQLSNYANGRDNNFNLLRFIAASAVLFSHSFPLALGKGAMEPGQAAVGMSCGSIAVDVFFVTSGFLIAGSYFQKKNFLAFAWARMLRIYPGLIVSILFCVFVVGMSFTTLTPHQYLMDTKTHAFLVKNASLFFDISFELPGVFADLPYKNSVNGSLWTLPFEVKMYACLALIGGLIPLVQRYRPVSERRLFLGIFVGAVCADVANQLANLLPALFLHLFAMFFSGAAYYVWRQRVVLCGRWSLAAASLALLASAAGAPHTFYLAYLICLPYIVLYLAYVPSGLIRRFNAYGDYSYGIYVYAFPVQQSIAALTPGISVTSMFASAFGVTLCLAWLSWHLVEKRCLKMKGDYVWIEGMLQTVRYRLSVRE